jgi:hypothetical protein
MYRFSGISINFVLQSCPSDGLERSDWNKYWIDFSYFFVRENNHLCSFHPCTVDRIDSSPRSSGNIGYIRFLVNLRPRWAGGITYTKCFGINFITCPTAFFCLREKLHISMCHVGFMMGEKSENADL